MCGLMGESLGPWDFRLLQKVTEDFRLLQVVAEIGFRLVVAEIVCKNAAVLLTLLSVSRGRPCACWATRAAQRDMKRTKMSRDLGSNWYVTSGYLVCTK